MPTLSVLPAMRSGGQFGTAVLAFRCYTKYVQIQFFRGTSLDPAPPKASKHDEVRYFDIYEDDDLDEDQLLSWIEQASNLPWTCLFLKRRIPYAL